MRLRRLGQWIDLADVDADLAAAHHVEQIACGREQLFPARGVVAEARMRHIERAELAEPPRRHRVGIAGRLAERCQNAAAGQTVQRILERRLADGIEDDWHALPASDRPHALDEILLAVDDRMIAAAGARDRSLLLTADGTDHDRTEELRPLADDE